MLLKWTAFLVLALATSAVIAALVLLSRASVQTTAHGAPTRLRLPAARARHRGRGRRLDLTAPATS